MSRSLWNPSLDSVHPVEGYCFLLVPIYFSESGFSVVAASSMFPALWIAPPVALFFILHCRVGSIGGLARHIDFNVLYFPLRLADRFWYS